MPTDDDLYHELALTLLPGIGPQLTRQLMSYGGSAQAVLTMPPGKLRRIPGVGDVTVQALTGKAREAAFRKAEADLQKAEKDAVEIIFYTSKRFPTRLTGEVFEGVWNGTTKVAAKKLKQEDANEIIFEANILRSNFQTFCSSSKCILTERSTM